MYWKDGVVGSEIKFFVASCLFIPLYYANFKWLHKVWIIQVDIGN